MTSRIEILEVENVKLKEDKRKLTKHFGHKKVENQMATSILKVCVLISVFGLRLHLKTD